MRPCQSFTDFIQAIVEGAWTPRKLDKAFVRQVLSDAGLPQPALLQEAKDPAEFDFASLPESFVLKPTHLHSGHGVHVLLRQGDAYLDLRSDQILQPDEIVSRLRQIAVEREAPEGNKYWAEERVWNPDKPKLLPLEFKVHVFDDQVGMITQLIEQLSFSGLAVTDADFTPLDDTEFQFGGTQYAQKAEPIRPHDTAQMKALALAATRAADRPFLRVDLLWNGSEFWIGELTQDPGNVYYGYQYRLSPNLDRAFGEKCAAGFARRGWDIPHIENDPPCYYYHKLLSQQAPED